MCCASRVKKHSAFFAIVLPDSHSDLIAWGQVIMNQTLSFAICGFKALAKRIIASIITS